MDEDAMEATEREAAEGVASERDPARDAIYNEVVGELCNVFDPEIPVNIYELGLVYDIVVSPEHDVEIVMTLTSPMCPVAESLPVEVEMRVRGIEGIGDVHVELTWDPPWTPERMTEAAKLELGFI